MKRLCQSFAVLALSASVVLAATPCKTRDEAMAEAVVGYFFVQGIAAGRCDELIGGAEFAALHDEVAAEYGAQHNASSQVRVDYFKRAHGEQWVAKMEQVDDLMQELFSSSLALDPESCGGFKAELQRRLATGWDAIRERLARRIEGVHKYDKNICPS